MNEAGSRKQRVYLVDDHPIVRDGLAMLINREKDLMVCGESGDVSHALQAVKETKPDILIVDLTLEHGSGIRLIENIMYSHKNLPILVLSMHDESVFAKRCIKAGARGYIMKEESPEKTLQAIRSLLGGETYFSDKLEKKLLHELLAGKKAEYASPVEVLSNRELEIYQLFGRGQRKGEIAEQLHLSVKTIENTIKHIMKKLNLESSREIVVHAARFNKDFV